MEKEILTIFSKENYIQIYTNTKKTHKIFYKKYKQIDYVQNRNNKYYV